MELIKYIVILATCNSNRKVLLNFLPESVYTVLQIANNEEIGGIEM